MTADERRLCGLDLSAESATGVEQRVGLGARPALDTTCAILTAVINLGMGRYTSERAHLRAGLVRDELCNRPEANEISEARA